MSGGWVICFSELGQGAMCCSSQCCCGVVYFGWRSAIFAVYGVRIHVDVLCSIDCRVMFFFSLGVVGCVVMWCSGGLLIVSYM